MANFKEFTRYTNGVADKNRSGQDFLVLRKPLNLEPQESDTFVTVSQELLNRPDMISYDVYGTVDLWWVIFEFNKINDPLFDLKLGQQIRIPDKDRVIEAINKIGT